MPRAAIQVPSDALARAFSSSTYTSMVFIRWQSQRTNRSGVRSIMDSELNYQHWGHVMKATFLGHATVYQPAELSPGWNAWFIADYCSGWLIDRTARGGVDESPYFFCSVSVRSLTKSLPSNDFD